MELSVLQRRHVYKERPFDSSSSKMQQGPVYLTTSVDPTLVEIQCFLLWSPCPFFSLFLWQTWDSGGPRPPEPAALLWKHHSHSIWSNSEVQTPMSYGEKEWRGLYLSITTHTLKRNGVALPAITTNTEKE